MTVSYSSDTQNSCLYVYKVARNNKHLMFRKLYV